MDDNTSPDLPTDGLAPAILLDDHPRAGGGLTSTPPPDGWGRAMWDRFGLASSVLVHSILFLSVIGWLDPTQKLPQEEAIPVTLVPAEVVQPPPLPPPRPLPAESNASVLAKQQGHSAPPSPAKADGETKSADVPSPRDAKDAKDAESDLLASIGIAMYSRPTTLAKDEFAAVKAQAMRCWDIPAGWTEPRQVSVTVRFRLNPDGTLDGAPSVVQFPASELGKAAAVSAVEAVVQCGPFQLPADKYDQWDDIQLRFEP